jgi:hypothetical protein
LLIGADKFVGKNDVITCGRPGSIKLVNEIIYWEYGVKAGLRMPKWRLLTCKGTRYFGSEFLDGRKEFREADSLEDLFDLFCPSRNRNLPSGELAAILSRRNVYDPATPPL